MLLMHVVTISAFVHVEIRRGRFSFKTFRRADNLTPVMEGRGREGQTPFPWTQRKHAVSAFQTLNHYVVRTRRCLVV